MGKRDTTPVKYFDPDRRRAARRRETYLRAAIAVTLFAAVCAAALSLSPPVSRKVDAGGGASPSGGTFDAPADGADPSGGTFDNTADAANDEVPPDSDMQPEANKIIHGEFGAELAALLEANPEARDYVDGFSGALEPDPELDISDELTSGDIPYLSQLDPRWGYCRYDVGLIGWTGCGPTALSMVAMGLTGDGTLTPSFVADLAARNGYCVAGDGTAWLFFSQGAALLGLSAKELPLWEPTMRAELEAGRPIICIMGPGHFTTTGHYVVITGCGPDGFDVLDPARKSNCGVWAYEDISGEIRNLWSYELVE